VSKVKDSEADPWCRRIGLAGHDGVSGHRPGPVGVNDQAPLELAVAVAATALPSP